MGCVQTPDLWRWSTAPVYRLDLHASRITSRRILSLVILRLVLSIAGPRSRATAIEKDPTKRKGPASLFQVRRGRSVLIDIMTGRDPGAGAAYHVEDVAEALFLEQARGDARPIAAGTDHNDGQVTAE